MPTRGVLRACVDPSSDVPVVLRVSGGTSVLKEDLSDEGLTVSMKDAVRLNVSGVALSVFVGSTHERQTLLSLPSLLTNRESTEYPCLPLLPSEKRW